MAGEQIEILIRKATELVANEGMEAPPVALTLATAGLMVERITTVAQKVDAVGQKIDDLGKVLRWPDPPKKPRHTIAIQITSLAGLGAAVGVIVDRILGR